MKFGMYPDRVWWTRPGFIAAGAFLLLVALLAIWIATTRTTATPDATGPVTTLTPPSPENGGPVTAAPVPVSRSAPVDDQAVPTQAPSDVSWALWHGIALPTSPSAGPSNVHDGIAEGYTHTPTGALLAATQIVFRADYGPTAEVISAQVVAGSGRDKLLAHPAPPKESIGAPQIAGFKFASYGADRADIEIVLQTKQGPLASLLFSMSWVDGDWRLIPTLDGDITASTKPVANLAGYISWSGVA